VPLYLPYISPASPLHLPSQVLELVRAGVLTLEEVEQVIGIEFNPNPSPNHNPDPNPNPNPSPN